LFLTTKKKQDGLADFNFENLNGYTKEEKGSGMAELIIMSVVGPKGPSFKTQQWQNNFLNLKITSFPLL
jgi:hypothetical protein